MQDNFLCDILLPTFNEKMNVILMLRKLQCRKYHILIVDDSTDCTFNLIEEYIKEHQLKNITLIKGRGEGLGGAYRMAPGYLKTDRICIIDSDLSHNPNDIKYFLQFNADIVTGNRYRDMKIKRNWKKLCNCCSVVEGEMFYGENNMTRNRKIISLGANYVMQVLLNREYDFTSSFRIYRKNLFLKILQHSSSNSFSFQVEALSYAIINGYSIVEIPILFVDRVEGESKISSTHILIFIMSFFKIAISYLKSLLK